jgi:TPR repeat protein
MGNRNIIESNIEKERSLKVLSKKGNMQAQNELGLFYYNRFIDTSTEAMRQTIYWLKKSAYQGYLEAQYNLFIIYYYDKDIKKDINRALYWMYKCIKNFIYTSIDVNYIMSNVSFYVLFP